MSKPLVFTIWLIILISVNASMNTQDSCNAGGKNCGFSEEYERNVELHLKMIASKVKDELPFYRYMTVEWYENGKIKSTRIGTNWKVVFATVLSLGLATGLVGAASVYCVGPAKVIAVIKQLADHQVIKIIATASV